MVKFLIAFWGLIKQAKQGREEDIFIAICCVVWVLCIIHVLCYLNVSNRTMHTSKMVGSPMCSNVLFPKCVPLMICAWIEVRVNRKSWSRVPLHNPIYFYDMHKPGLITGPHQIRSRSISLCWVDLNLLELDGNNFFFQ
jgi:hypothetical protein